MKVEVQRFLSPAFKLALFELLKGATLPDAFKLGKVYALAKDGRERQMEGPHASPDGQPCVEYTAVFCEGETIVAFRIEFADQTMEVCPLVLPSVQSGTDPAELRLRIEF